MTSWVEKHVGNGLQRNGRNIPPLKGGENVTLPLLQYVTQGCYAIVKRVCTLGVLRNTVTAMLRPNVTKKCYGLGK